MNDALQIAPIATLLADPARAAILWTLIDGTSRPAGELAFAANISAPSASGHLARLVEGGLLQCEAHGRHRYFRIASTEAAEMIEGLASFGASIAARAPGRPRIARAMPNQFLHARTCYDHLAGDVAVKVLQTMVARRWLVADGPLYEATGPGSRHLSALGIDLDEASRGRRAFARSCVDLTERRPHLAGMLGAALLRLYVEKGWVERTMRSRIVRITPKGHEAFVRHLGIPA